MRPLMLVFTFLLLCVMQSSAQYIKGVFSFNGNIFLEYNHAQTSQITDQGEDQQPILSKDTTIVYFLRTTKDTTDAEDYPLIIESKIIEYNLEELTEFELVKGCQADGLGSSTFSYADTEKYPFSGLCNISKIALSPDEQRIYFETDAWVVSPAVHYYDLATKQIYFFHDGWLGNIHEDGKVEIVITRIYKEMGRYTQLWLCNENGKEIKALGKKEF